MSKTVSIRPLDDRILLKPDEPESTSKGGILLPGIALDKFPALGVVLAVGPGKMNGEGVRRPLSMKAGDRIIYGRYQGTDVEVAGETVKFLRADDVLAVLEPVEETPLKPLLPIPEGFAHCPLKPYYEELANKLFRWYGLTEPEIRALTLYQVRRLIDEWPGQNNKGH